MLRGYRRDQLRPDLLAGVTGAAVAVPAGLAMGELAGLSPVAGLYATMLPLVAYALFTSARHVMVGPDGTLAVLTASTVAPLAAGSATRAKSMLLGVFDSTGLTAGSGRTTSSRPSGPACVRSKSGHGRDGVA